MEVILFYTVKMHDERSEGLKRTFKGLSQARRDAIRSTPGTSPPHLGGRTGRDADCACVGKGQTKSNQEGKAFGVTSVYTPILSREGCLR